MIPWKTSLRVPGIYFAMSASYSLVSANCLVFFVLFLWQFQNLTLSCCPIFGRQSSDAVKKRFGFSETNTIAYFSLTRVCCCLDSHIFLAFFSRLFFLVSFCCWGSSIYCFCGCCSFSSSMSSISKCEGSCSGSGLLPSEPVSYITFLYFFLLLLLLCYVI